MIKLENVSKIYQTKTRRVAALKNLSFALPERGLVFILGHSGSGKSTLLNLLGGLDAPTEGELLVEDVSSRDFKQADFDSYRNRYVGFVFQEYHLLDDYTVADNIALALELQGDLTPEERQQKIAAALSQVDLAGYGDRNTGELSGGQKQRVAIARALVKDPPMILADEPTGALDRKTGRQLFDLLKAISKDKLVVVVSHDEDFAHEYADRILVLEEGEIVSDSAPAQQHTEPKSKGQARLPSSKIPPRVAARLGWDSLKKRKMAFSFVAVLCTAAFLLVGAADMLACYDKETVLLKSLEEQKPRYLSVTREYYNTYDFTRVSPMLPTQESLSWYQTSGVAVLGGTAGWYNGYMLDDEDLTDLEARTGSVVKGVYVPPQKLMCIAENYVTRSDAVFGANPQYVQELRGFMELDASTMDAFGLSLLEGALPDGTKDEIAISKAVYDSFQSLGYLEYDYQVKVSYYQYINGQREEGFFKIPWNDFAADSVQQMNRLEAAVLLNNGKIDSAPHGVCKNVTQFVEPEQMRDLIGKTIFIENREYTISGIIDTNLSPSLTEEELSHEYQYGLAALAFVGVGKIEEIAARYPETVTLNDCRLYRSDTSDDKISVQRVVRASDLDPTYVVCSEENADLYVSPGTLWNPAFSFEQSGDRLYESAKDKFGITVQWPGASVIYSRSALTMKQIEYTDAGKNAYHMDLYSDSPLWNNLDLCSFDDVLILDDYYFDLFTEGRAGRYAYAVISSVDSSRSVTTIAKGCLEEKDSTRYQLEVLTAYQLNRLDETLRSMGKLFQYVSMGMVLFAVGLFAAFIITGLHGKKQQIGIMRAMGAGSRDVFAIFFTEGLLVAAVSAVLAIMLTAITAGGGSALLRSLFDLRLTLLIFSPRQAAMIFALSFGIAILASLIPILRIARQKPVDAIRKS